MAKQPSNGEVVQIAEYIVHRRRFSMNVVRLIPLVLLLVFLVAVEVACTATDKESIETTVASPVTEEKRDATVEDPVVAEEKRDATVEDLVAKEVYLDEGIALLEEIAVIIDDILVWTAAVIVEYEAGSLFPDTAPGEAALARLRYYAERVEALTVPPAYTKSHSLWIAANDEYITGLELEIAGVEQFDPSLIEAGTAHVEEGTRLLEKSTATFEAGQ